MEKKEKGLYSPKTKPEVIHIPTFRFLTLSGEGNPNSELFAACIAGLYSLSYAIKMTPKTRDIKPKDYYDYTVYPLEGVWDINDAAKKTFNGTINKDDLVFKLMIRQPDFLSQNFFEEMLALVKEKKPQPILEKIRFEEITEGKCIQMLHIGPYDNESESFEVMEKFAEAQNLKRISKVHREIYLSDFRKVAPEKLKTVLRFNVE